MPPTTEQPNQTMELHQLRLILVTLLARQGGKAVIPHAEASLHVKDQLLISFKGMGRTMHLKVLAPEEKEDGRE